ncbi:MAG: ABC transporter permease [Spirochaetes bacterium]|jgi:putative ABC transport system permease protein|nr:ABC transporter permease [Spirochaetota bacterium]
MTNIKNRISGIMALTTIAWRNIWRNGRRTALCIIAVAIAVFFIIIMRSWIDGMFTGLEDIVRTYETGHVSIVSARYDADRESYPVQFPVADGASSQSLIQQIETMDGVRAVLPRITTYATLFDSTKKHALIWGINIEKETAINDLNLTKKTNGIIDGHFPETDTNGCAIGKVMAQKTGLKIGDSIPLKMVSAQFSDKYWNPVITGIFSFDYQKFDEDTIVVPIDRLQKILGLDDATQQLVVFAHDSRDSSSLRNRLRSVLPKDSVIKEWDENYWVAMFQSMTGLYLIIFAVFQIIASFLIINTMLMIIHERIKEIGMMGALGMKRTEIVIVFFLEALILSTLGAAVGALTGGIASYLGSLYPIDMNIMTGGGMKDFPISGTLYLDFSFATIIEGFFFGIIVTGICTLFPSLKSAFILPVEALRR